MAYANSYKSYVIASTYVVNDVQQMTFQITGAIRLKGSIVHRRTVRNDD